MTDPDFNLLIALDALLTAGSVVGAARRLGLSASAMSRTLSRLRAATGDPLLVRAGRHMVLTPYAETLRERTPYAETLRERTRNTAFEARALLRPAQGALDPAELDRTFTLRANDGFVEAFGPALIAAAAEQAPRVRLRFAPKPEKSDRPLREGLVDLEIGVLGDMGPEIRLQALFRDRFVGVMRTSHPLAQQPEIGAADYAACGHVVASRSGRILGPVDAALAELGLTRQIAAVVPSFPAALAVAQASNLLALLPASFLHAQPAEGPLRVFELPVKTPPITVSQMWHPRLEAEADHRWLRQLVLSVCRQRVQEPFRE
ncbi:LysR family transcriptional regulator [Serratia marcescens]|uniref:LysR family transcriptional regulator n=5 Tax=Gammaproteobacteria TaxID=1236 RepID=UPI001882F968|nr:LysR family transcriptional regulator [Serratia marcescens]MBE8814912.1 LysR family transcriptional regulator [Serratia marcescens]